MFKVSVTTLEQFNSWRKDTKEENPKPEQDVIDSIMQVTKPSVYMRIGGAVADYLETPSIAKDSWLEMPSVSSQDEIFPGIQAYDVHGILFDREGLERIRDIAYATEVEREVPGQMTYRLSSGVFVEARARADGIEGAFIGHEYKTAYSPKSYEDYYDSYQWRFYADIFGLSHVKYTVFHMSGVTLPIGLSYPSFFDYYPALDNHEQCLELLEEFMDYVFSKGLEGYLKGRKR